MKKRLFLHIGMGKTGTTALQQFFWENRQRLLGSGICYPKYGIVENAHHLMSPYIPPHLAGQWDFKAVDQWAPKLSKVTQETVLLSSELIAWTEEDEVQKFCTDVKKWFDLHVVIYLRRQDNIIMASFNQQVKAGQQKRPINATLKRLRADFDYLKIITPWASELGKDHITVRAYEQEQFYEADIRRDFMFNVFQMEVGKGFRFNQENYNPRLTLATSNYKLFINSITYDERRNARLNDLLAAYSEETQNSDMPMFSDHSALSTAQRLEILDASQEINATIARSYLGREDGKLFFEPDPIQEDHGSRDGESQITYQWEAITRYLRDNDRGLIRWLTGEIGRNKDSRNREKRFSAHALAQFVDEPAEK